MNARRGENAGEELDIILLNLFWGAPTDLRSERRGWKTTEKQRDVLRGKVSAPRGSRLLGASRRARPLLGACCGPGRATGLWAFDAGRPPCMQRGLWSAGPPWVTDASATSGEAGVPLA